MVWGAPDRRATLAAARGFLALEPRAPELQLLHRCVDTWQEIGDVVAGVARQEYDLSYVASMAAAGPRASSQPASSARSPARPARRGR